MARFSKEDWLDLGARLLAEEGPPALTLERLTAAARRTRGSFYHHFEDREDFVLAMVERWRKRVIDGEAARYLADPRPEAWRQLMREAPEVLDYRFERELRRLAAAEPPVRAALKEVDRTRIEGATRVFEMLQSGRSDNEARAFILYAALVGAQWLMDESDPRVEAIRDTTHRLFELDEPAQPKPATKKRRGA